MSSIEHFSLIKQGAEARIYSGTYLGKAAIIKERFIKKYRHSDLDTMLTKDRMKAESRAIVRCKSAGIITPAIFLVDFDRRRIYMEKIINSLTVKEFIISLDAENYENKLLQLGEYIGNVIGKMHLNNIIHGDLTTSNILVINDNSKYCEHYKLALIDFGLAHLDSSAEDKGVDLYVLERAILSTHANADKLLEGIFKSYKQTNKKNSNDVLLKYKEIKARGRKRTMVG